MATTSPILPQPSGSTHASKRAQPLPRRSTLVRKRDDSSSDHAPSSPTKKVRVTFDNDVEVRTVGQFEKAPELIQQEVRSAFQKRAHGDNTGYERIKAIYDKKTYDGESVTPFSLSQYTVALLGNIPSLNRSTADLVRVVIQSEWLGREEDYAALYMRLLANIVTAQGSFLLDTLTMLVENLTDTPPSSRRLPETPPISRTKLYLRVHKTLQYLIRIFPAATSVLQRTISENFPGQDDSRRSHVIYTQNLLKILDYAPELRPDTLALITERLVKIDVQVQVDIEDLEDEEGEGLVEKLPQIRPDLLDEFEDDSDSSDDDSDPDDDEDEDEEAQRTKKIRKNVEKMDSMLDILFSYYSRDFESSKTSTAASVVIEILMSQFVTTILSTHRSRHTQFLLFHFAQQSPDYVDILVGTCVQKVLDKKQPTLTRQNASAYLASFVARGMHVPSNVVRDVFDYIRDELDRLRAEIEPTCSGPDLRRYSSYYCLVQSLLYIFCFRWRDLELRYEDEEEDDDEDLDAPYSQGHQWRPGTKEAFNDHLVFSKLNPLKVCSPAITEEFARVAKHLGVIFIFHIIETNKRIRLANYSVSMLGSMYGQPDREGALSVSQDEGHHHLDAYFPFDPYHLPKSKRWIEGDYRDWSPVPGLNDEEADDSDSDDEDDVGDSDFDGTETDGTGAST